MPFRRLAPLALVVLALLAAPATAAAASRIDVPVRAARVIDRIAARSAVPIYLPTAFTIHGRHQGFATGGKLAKGWQIDFGYTRDCNGAHACEMAYFYAERGATPSGGKRVALAHGIVGRYHVGSCGASCAAPSIEFKVDGVLYAYSVTDPVAKPRLALIAMARQAINYGPR